MSSSRRSLVDQYFQDIEAVRGLSSEKEKELSQRIQEGDEGALKELVQANLLFVVTIAKEYRDKGLPFCDLISIGNLGLIMAAKRFDSAKGFRFITYAVWWIRQAILQAMKDQQHIVRLPLNKIDELAKIKKGLSRLEQKLGHLPESGEIAEELSVNLDDMDMLLHMVQSPVSLEAPLNEDDPGRCFLDLLSDDSYQQMDESISQEELKTTIHRALKTLTEREALILCLYYGLSGQEPMTLEEVGVYFGLTRERIRQIKEKALQKLRHPAVNKALRECFAE